MQSSLNTKKRGYPACDPRLMVRLLIYGYTAGVRSPYGGGDDRRSGVLFLNPGSPHYMELTVDRPA